VPYVFVISNDDDDDEEEEEEEQDICLYHSSVPETA
jgi:hypothetical protein